MADFFESIPQEKYNLLGELLKAVMWYPTGNFKRSALDDWYEDTAELDKRRGKYQREEGRRRGTSRSEWDNERERMLMERQLAKSAPQPGPEIEAFDGGEYLFEYPSLEPAQSSGGRVNVKPMTRSGMALLAGDGDYISEWADVPAYGGVDSDSDYISQGVAPPPTPNSWDAFMALNPNIDLDKIARQAGGKPGSFPVTNEFGGAISEMPDTRPPEQSDEAFYDFVYNQIPLMEAERLRDSRSRAYNPDAAQSLVDMVNERRRIATEEAGAKVQQQLADIAMMEQTRQSGIGGRIDAMLKAVADSGISMEAPDIVRKLIVAKDAAMRGDERLANQIVLEISKQLGGQPGAAVSERPTSVPGSAGADLVYSGGRIR